jgi:hypothetical protein
MLADPQWPSLQSNVLRSVTIHFRIQIHYFTFLSGACLQNSGLSLFCFSNYNPIFDLRNLPIDRYIRCLNFRLRFESVSLTFLKHKSTLGTPPICPFTNLACWTWWRSAVVETSFFPPI